MKLSKKLGVLLLALAVVLTLVVIPAPEVNAYVASPNNVIQTGASGTSISIKWDAVAGATGYKLELCVGGYSGQIYQTTTVASNVTAYTFQNAPKGVEWVAKVYTLSSAGASSASYKYVYSAPATPANIYLYQWKPNTAKPYVKWAGKLGASYGYYPTGYEVKFTTLAGKKIKTYKTTGTYIQKTIKKAKNEGFKISIRSYRTINTPSGQAKIYSDWSKTKYFVSYPKIKKSVHYLGSSTSTVTWKKVKNAKKYVIYKVSGSYGNYKLKKWKTVSGSTTSISVPRSYGKIVIVPQIKVKGKTYKYKKGDYDWLSGTYV